MHKPRQSLFEVLITSACRLFVITVALITGNINEQIFNFAKL